MSIVTDEIFSAGQTAADPNEARARVCIRFVDVLDGFGRIAELDVAYVAEVGEEVEIGIERTVQGKTVYQTTGYVPVHIVRRATRREIEEWRAAC